jgi:capsular exopolysaccharide synthesis family protein
VAQALISDRNQIDLLKSAQTGDAQVVQTAGVPTSASSPKPKTTGLIGLLLGLLLGGVLVAVLERRDHRIKDIDQIEQIYGAPVIGTVPESSALRGSRPLGPREEEPFAMLRAQLRYFDLDREIKRVLVTSADSGEGKTMVSLNLARAAARADGKRALLIEADMRRPTLSRLIRRDFVAGLSELLSHSQDVESALRELVVSPGLAEDNGHASGLDVLLAGSPPANPGELLESERMQQVLEAADSVYDIVVIDTAPIGAVSDAMPLARRVDGVLVIARMGRSRRDHAVRLMKWLHGLNAHVLGVVVNSFRQSADQSYGYYGSYGYSPRRRAPRLGGRSRQKVGG